MFQTFSRAVYVRFGIPERFFNVRFTGLEVFGPGFAYAGQRTI
jgi:hypothetical protein